MALPLVLTQRDPCPLTGRPCAAAQALMDALAAAIAATGEAAGPDFRLKGAVEAFACGRSCRLDWSGSCDAIAIVGAGPQPGGGPVLRAERRPERLS